MNSIGNPFIELPTVESSNNYAIGQVQAHLAGHGTTWFAHEQTRGKGQRGKVWSASPGQNIVITTIVEPNCLRLTDQFIVSAAVALACHDLLNAYASTETNIKWPNDIYWKDRKAGGILIENILQGSEWKYAIIGIGMNINQTDFPSILANPVSLKQITGRTFKPIDLATELCTKIEKRWRQVLDGAFDEILQQYNAVLYKANEIVVFKKDQVTLSGTVRGVNKNGDLILGRREEDNIAIRFGEWKWILNSD